MLKSTSQLLHKIGFSGPGILIDDDQARINIRAMAEKARRADARFRPHFKTHQSAEVGGWFAEEGVTAITVSSVAMAEYFAKHGWYDITIAFLLNPLEGPRIIKLANHLAALGGRLALTIDSTAAATWLVDHADCPLGVWLKIDTGYGRTGIPWQNKELIQTLVDQLAKNVPIHGLLTHSGTSSSSSVPGGGTLSSSQANCLTRGCRSPVKRIPDREYRTNGFRVSGNLEVRKGNDSEETSPHPGSGSFLVPGAWNH